MKKPKYFGEHEFQAALVVLGNALDKAALVFPLENKGASYINPDVGEVEVVLFLDRKGSSELVLHVAIKIENMRVKSILASGDKERILKWIAEHENVELLRDLLMEKYKNIYMNLDRQRFDRD